MSLTAEAKRGTFKRLHESGCFIIPNAYDVGTAKALEYIGFKAIASTSAGFAWSIGKSDNKVSLDELCDHLSSLCSSVEVPVNADFEGGFARDPDGVGKNVERALATGLAGLSIEDYTGDEGAPIYPHTLAVERIKAARAAIDSKTGDVILVGRCEALLHGAGDLKFVIERLQAYADAGADCLFAPGLASREDIATVVKAVAPKPVTIINTAPDKTLDDIASLGVRRISVGGGLARVAWSGFMRAAKDMVTHGTFSEFSTGFPGRELNTMFAEHRASLKTVICMIHAKQRTTCD
jgi:2-methylisocitrate lyase-like PEP mutase family enzyme